MVAGGCNSDLSAPTGGVATSSVDPEPDAGRCANFDPDEPGVDGFVHLAEFSADGPAPGLGMEVVAVALSSTLAVSCSGLDGLSVWDATHPSEPVALIRGIAPMYAPSAGIPRCSNLALGPGATRVVISHRGDEVTPTSFVAAYDLSEPSAPVQLDSWSTSASMEGVAFDGQDVFVAAHGDGLAQFRLGETLEAVTSVTPPGADAWEPAIVSSGVVAVAEGAVGLRLYARGSEGLSVLGAVSLPGSATDLAVHAGRAYVSTSRGIGVVDISDARAPRLTSTLETEGTPVEVALAGDDLLVVAEWDRLRGYAISETGELHQAFSEEIPTVGPFARVLAVDARRETGDVLVGEWRSPHAYRLQPLGIGPDVLVRPAALEFGKVEPGVAVDRVVVLENHGNRPLQVERISSLVPGISADPPTLCVDAGGAKALEVRLDPVDADPVRATVSIETNDVDDSAALVRVSANVEGAGIGDTVPRFELRSLAGEVWRSEDLRGQVVVLAYFATF